MTGASDPAAKYSGRERRPAVGAAHVGHDDAPQQATDAPGNDGLVWRVIG